MTYNVHSCVGVDRRVDLGRVAAVIAQCKPDIVALQELDVGRPRTGGEDQAHAIAAKLGMAFHFHPTIQVAEEQYGDALLTALPMRLVKTGALPTLQRGPKLERRGALWAAIAVEGGELQVINTHLGLVPLEQRSQMACLTGRDWLGHEDCTGPVVMLGDFNATPRYAAYAQATAKLRDARRLVGGAKGRGAPTFPSRFPMLRIDHIFVDQGIEVLDLYTPDGPLARAASDHLPLVADIRVKAGRKT
jgi:endonuclease/exonuclease/phosphatase family metal-dependent hydrolase